MTPNDLYALVERAIKRQGTHPAQSDTIVYALRETAILCGESCLPFWNAAHPNDDRPRRAIDAARACLANPSDENREAAYQGAHHAWLAYAPMLTSCQAAWAAYAAAKASYTSPKEAAAWAKDTAGWSTWADLTPAINRMNQLFTMLESTQ